MQEEKTVAVAVYGSRLWVSHARCSRSYCSSFCMGTQQHHPAATYAMVCVCSRTTTTESLFIDGLHACRQGSHGLNQL
jgi:hypothetical protein